jgi:hypothetical protein
MVAAIIFVLVMVICVCVVVSSDSECNCALEMTGMRFVLLARGVGLTTRCCVMPQIREVRSVVEE